MSYEATGVIVAIFPTENRSDKFSSREFVLQIPDGNYPQLIKFQAVQDRCQMLDQYAEGQQVKVHFDLRGREWNGKYLTNLNAWKIVGAAGEKREPLPPPIVYTTEAYEDAKNLGAPIEINAPAGNTDDLPF